MRSLEREIANLARKSLKEIVGGERKSVTIDAPTSATMPACASTATARPSSRTRSASSPALPGHEVGGELLSIEAVTVPGKGKMTITGKLGDVMQESVQAARAYVRSRALVLGIRPETFDEARHPHPRARGGDPQGRPLRRHRHGDLDRLGR